MELTKIITQISFAAVAPLIIPFQSHKDFLFASIEVRNEMRRVKEEKNKDWKRR
jgi:hypothetical protein